MALLKTVHKEFIVIHLAMNEEPTQVATLVKEQFGIDVTRQQVSFYNPKTVQGARELSSKWISLYEETRQKYLTETVDIPIAHQAYRLRMHQKFLDEFIKRGNFVEARNTVVEAGKETGDIHEAGTGDIINFYQQINQKIIQMQGENK